MCVCRKGASPLCTRNQPLSHFCSGLPHDQRKAHHRGGGEGGLQKQKHPSQCWLSSPALLPGLNFVPAEEEALICGGGEVLQECWRVKLAFSALCASGCVGLCCSHLKISFKNSSKNNLVTYYAVTVQFHDSNRAAAVML